jgi:hypothetical protein
MNKPPPRSSGVGFLPTSFLKREREKRSQTKQVSPSEFNHQAIFLALTWLFWCVGWADYSILSDSIPFLEFVKKKGNNISLQIFDIKEKLFPE